MFSTEITTAAGKQNSRGLHYSLLAYSLVYQFRISLILNLGLEIQARFGQFNDLKGRCRFQSIQLRHGSGRLPCQNPWTILSRTPDSDRKIPKTFSNMGCIQRFSSSVHSAGPKRRMLYPFPVHFRLSLPDICRKIGLTGVLRLRYHLRLKSHFELQSTHL